MRGSLRTGSTVRACHLTSLSRRSESASSSTSESTSSSFGQSPSARPRWTQMGLASASRSASPGSWFGSTIFPWRFPPRAGRYRQGVRPALVELLEATGHLAQVVAAGQAAVVARQDEDGRARDDIADPDRTPGGVLDGQAGKRRVLRPADQGRTSTPLQKATWSRILRIHGNGWR